MKEIPPPTLGQLGYTPTGAVCPKCKGSLWFGFVPCPDGMPGCCVAHYGYRCEQCDRKFTNG